MLHYIIQITAFQVFFLLIYDLFLKRETFFNWNRFYLLGTAILSLILPFIKLDAIKGIASENFVINLPEVILGTVAPTASEAQAALNAGIVLEQPTPLWEIILWIGIIVSALVFIFKITKLFWLKHQSPKRWNGNVLIVNLLNSKAAFSFFNNIFLGEKIGKKEQPVVLKHELVHVNEKHSIDLLFFEMLRILMWFNPLVYMYQNRIKALHEYIADAIAVKEDNKVRYYQSLLNQVFETNNLSFTNTFFNKSLIKKRIIMLQKSKSNKVKLFKYALIIPLVFGMLFYVSCEKEVEADIENQTIDNVKFEYSLRLGEEMSPETKKIHDGYEEFLKSNADYVSWAEINFDTKRINYSVHHKNETPPEESSELEVNSPDGRSYKSFMNLSRDKTLIENLETEDYSNALEVPFSRIDEVPTFKECDDLLSEEERRKCMTNTVSKFVIRNFNTDLAGSLGLQGRLRISVFFKIDEDGNVISIKARAPHEALQEEAKRVMDKLPQMVPGKHNGKNVTVPYSLPIIFQVQ
jgi:bla regulator protein BlaR1